MNLMILLVGCLTGSTAALWLMQRQQRHVLETMLQHSTSLCDLVLDMADRVGPPMHSVDPVDNGQAESDGAVDDDAVAQQPTRRKAQASGSGTPAALEVAELIERLEADLARDYPHLALGAQTAASRHNGMGGSSPC